MVLSEYWRSLLSGITLHFSNPTVVYVLQFEISLSRDVVSARLACSRLISARFVVPWVIRSIT